jgi:hypothetical protein
VVDEMPFLPELDCDAPNPIEGTSRVDFVYTTLEPQFLLRGRLRSVVQSAAVEAQHVGLGA